MTEKKIFNKNIAATTSSIQKQSQRFQHWNNIEKNIYRRDIYVLMIVPHILDYKATITIANFVKWKLLKSHPDVKTTLVNLLFYM